MKRSGLTAVIATALLVGCAVFYCIDNRQPPIYGVNPPQGISYADYLFKVENAQNLAYWHKKASRPWTPEPDRVLARYHISYMTRETTDWPSLVTPAYRRDHMGGEKLQFSSSPYPNAFHLVKRHKVKSVVEKFTLHVTHRTSVPEDTFYSTWIIEVTRQPNGDWLVNDLI